MIQSVPVSSIIVMAVTAVICFALPVFSLIYLSKKMKCRQNYILVGIGTFIVFALVLESLLHQLTLHFFGKELTDNIWLYALYGGLAAGLFEETGRLISMKLFMKKDLTKANSIVYGIGHGGAEAVILGGMTYVSNVAVSVLINTGQFEPMLSSLDEATKAQVIEQYSALWTGSAGLFLLAAAERILSFVIQLCLSYLVYRAVKYKKPMFWILAVAAHFVIDAASVVIVKYSSAYVAECVLFVMTAALSAIVLKIFKAEKEAFSTAE